MYKVLFKSRTENLMNWITAYGFNCTKTGKYDFEISGLSEKELHIALCEIEWWESNYRLDTGEHLVGIKEYEEEF